MDYVPPLGATDADAGYQDGNPAAGIEGSPVPAAAIEHPMREIMSVIIGAGVTPSSTALSQLRLAIAAMIASATPPAASNTLGLVRPDGVTLAVSAEGILTALPSMAWTPTRDYASPCLVIGSDSQLYQWIAASGPAHGGAKDPVTAGAVHWRNVNASPAETYRIARIGCPHYLSTTTLPAGHMWADGSLALFADWPELAAKHASSGFHGMVLPASATAEQKTNYPDKFVEHPQALGLYMPRLGGLFMRNWCPGQTVDAGRAPGSYQGDAMRPIAGSFAIQGGGSIYVDNGLFIARYGEPGITAQTAGTGQGLITFDSSRVVPTAPEIRGVNASIPVAIYLGVPR